MFNGLVFVLRDKGGVELPQLISWGGAQIELALCGGQNQCVCVPVRTVHALGAWVIAPEILPQAEFSIGLWSVIEDTDGPCIPGCLNHAEDISIPI